MTFWYHSLYLFQAKNVELQILVLGEKEESDERTGRLNDLRECIEIVMQHSSEFLSGEYQNATW